MSEEKEKENVNEISNCSGKVTSRALNFVTSRVLQID